MYLFIFLLSLAYVGFHIYHVVKGTAPQWIEKIWALLLSLILYTGISVYGRIFIVILLWKKGRIKLKGYLKNRKLIRFVTLIGPPRVNNFWSKQAITLATR